MNLREIDSSKLLFDIHSKDLVEQFKLRFPEFEEYKGEVDARKVCQYICLMCDMKSPLVVEKPDYYQRKYSVALLAKFPMSKKEFTAESEAIIVGENDIVNQVSVAYIASYGMPNYTLLMAFMALMSFETQKVFAGRGGKDSQKIIDSASDRIQSLTRDFFKSGDYDEYSKIRQLLYSRIEKERLRLRPEQILRQLEDAGELPADFSPYPEGYKINLSEDMQFIGDGKQR